MRIFITSLLMLASLPNAQGKTINNRNIEMAAKMNVAENICEVNFGQGSGGVVHFVLLAAAELRVSVETAAQMADIRHREILKYIVRNNKTSEFCKNAKRNKL